MAKLPIIENDLNFIMEDGMVRQDKRDYVGYSSIGQKCVRKTWYSFRWVKTTYVNKRIQRIFDRGNLEEDRVAQDLTNKGCSVVLKQSEVIGYAGHVKGHIDGVVVGVPTAEKTDHLFECKTMKASKYKEYLKVGLKIFSSAYWQQIHSYSGKLRLKRILFVACNKDTEERDYKRINYDKDQFEIGEKIASFILMSDSAPERLPNSSPTYFHCKWCDYSDICHKGARVEKNCRTCKYWDIEDEGKFSCSKHNLPLSTLDQGLMSLCYTNDYELSESYV